MAAYETSVKSSTISDAIAKSNGRLSRWCVPKTLNPTVMVMKSAQDGT